MTTAMLLLVAVTTVACAANGGPVGPAAAPPRIANARWLLVPAHGALFGAWAEPSGGATAIREESAVADFERIIGRRLAIDNLYASWAAPLPLAVARWDLRHGTIPMISWNGASTSKIVDGTYDALIRARALQLRALRGPVMLRWFWEMDSGANAAVAGSPASFIAAWRHVYKIFAEVGATNVRWVWCPSGYGFAKGFAERFYPGSGYVDWVGADGYNWAPVRPVSWRTFGQIFAAFYKWGTTSGKPLLVGEFGAVERAPGQKAAWFSEAARQLRTQLPAIRAIIYFNSYRKNTVFDKYFNWKVTSSPSSLSAFRAFVNDPYFNARPSI
jgi:Glycosyl hydrolase family 26